MKITTARLYSPFALLILISLLCSCSNSKKLLYFTNLKRDSVIMLQAQAIQSIIAKNDVLQITIATPDQATNLELNPSQGSSSVSGLISGYLVDETGTIRLPMLGTIKAEGLTKTQLSQLITQQLLDKQLAKDPVVTVRILNYKITVLGEVNHPGVIAIPNERVTLPEALGYAGDLSVYGRRDSLLLMRQLPDGKVFAKRFSLQKDQVFDKDLYYLQNQDVIYVMPGKERSESTDRSIQYISVGMSAISLLLVIYLQLIKN